MPGRFTSIRTMSTGSVLTALRASVPFSAEDLVVHAEYQLKHIPDVLVVVNDQ
jgi:hypothetical protein